MCDSYTRSTKNIISAFCIKAHKKTNKLGTPTTYESLLRRWTAIYQRLSVLLGGIYGLDDEFYFRTAYDYSMDVKQIWYYNLCFNTFNGKFCWQNFYCQIFYELSKETRKFFNVDMSKFWCHCLPSKGVSLKGSSLFWKKKYKPI